MQRRTLLTGAAAGLLPRAALAQLAGARVLADRYGANINRMVVPKGKADWRAYVNEFVEEAKASGAVQQFIERGGTRGGDEQPGEHDGAEREQPMHIEGILCPFLRENAVHLQDLVGQRQDEN